MLRYLYTLPCGHSFYSTTLTIADSAGWHWFPCVPCDKDFVLTDDELVVEIPRRVNGSRYSDNQVSVEQDNAIKRQRVVTALRTWRNTVPCRVIAEWCGVSVIFVKKLSALGVQDP